MKKTKFPKTISKTNNQKQVMQELRLQIPKNINSSN